MSVGEQNSRITKPFDSKHLEELAKQSAPGSAESDPRPTCKIHKDDLLGLLDLSIGAAAAPPPDPTPAGSGTTHARLGAAGSSNDALATVRDDRETQRMQATHLQSMAEGGLPVTPALLESVDWYRDADAAAAQARSGPRAPEALLDELGHESPARDLAQPARSSAGLRIFISLIILATIGFAGFLGLQIAT